jgi:uncharacterized protein (DUF697 family)
MTATSAEAKASITERARQLAPVVWLLGKVQSGKTSIVRTLTCTSDAEIGNGFRACTRTARVFDFPADAPIIRFLDTRGLGEAAYDPAEDIAFCEERAHLILVVAKARDMQLEPVLDVLGALRRRHPDWPIVVAQTTLHESYAPGEKHVLPYPFGGEGEGASTAAPADLARVLDYQRGLFGPLSGATPFRFVPLDFTQEGDRLDPADYGREALIDALIAAAPAAVSLALAELPESAGASREANAHVFGYALAAGASDAVPLTGVATVPIAQAAMLHKLAKLNGMTWDSRAYAEFAGALGAGVLVRTASSFGLRQLVKLIPVYGQTAGAAAAAASSFAATYAMGKAASYFLTRRRRGLEVKDLASVYHRALLDAFRLSKSREREAKPSEGAQP